MNVALIGAGDWGKNLARALYQLKILKVICDPSDEVHLRKKAKYPDVQLSSSFSEILTQPDINGVVIATPAIMHFAMVKEALLAGKHVFVEKPLALTEREGQELNKLAKQVNRVLFVGHILHYHPAILKIKEMVQSGELGKLQYIYSNRLNLGKIRKEENILWSFAPHDISVILSLVGEEPSFVKAIGSSILHPETPDTTLTHLKFPGGASAHIFVSWLHPFKEQKLVVVGNNKMVVFDDTVCVEKKLTVYPHNILWKGATPISEKKDGVPIDLSADWKEPLLEECKAFVDGIHGKPVLTNGDEGLRVLRVLKQAQSSLEGGKSIQGTKDFFLHETSFMGEDCAIGNGTKIWHFSHILKGSKIGNNVNIGQNVVIGPNGMVGNNVKIQNNVSIYEGVNLEDDVFCGPSCVFTNVSNPRSAIPRKNEYKRTLVRRGATIGANATILCGNTIGKFSFIGAGTVVTRDIPDYALVVGNPAQRIGWICECGEQLNENGLSAVYKACRKKYTKENDLIRPEG